MASNFPPIGVDESQRQLFATSLRLRLEAELQQQVTIYAQQFGEAFVYHARCIVAEHIYAFLQSFQSIPPSPSPPPTHAAPNMALKVGAGALRCTLYLLLPVQPLSQTITFIFQGNLQSNLRSTPGAILQQALSSPDLIELLRRRHGNPSTYLPLRGVFMCPIVDKVRNFGRARRVGRAFEKTIRVAMKTFSNFFKNTSFGKLLERPVARFMLGLILERECANFGATPVFVDRARLYTVRLRGLTRYLDKICCSEEGMDQIINKVCIPIISDTSHSCALIRQSMSVGNYAPRLASSVASPRTVASPEFVPQIAESKRDTPRQTSTTAKFSFDTAPDSRGLVPLASSMNVLQHTTPVWPARIVPNAHARSSSSQVQHIVTRATQLLGATIHNVNTHGSPAIHGALPQSDAMEDCIPDPTRSQQVDTTDSHAGIPQAMDGVETTSASSHGAKVGQDEMDDVQHTSQPTVVPPASNLVQNENQNMPDAPPATKVSPNSTIESNGTPSGITVGEIQDQDMRDVPQSARSTFGLAIQTDLALASTIPVETKDQDMTDAPLPVQPTLGSSRRVSEAPNITVASSVTRSERLTSGLPLAPPTVLPSVRQPSSSQNNVESTIQSRARARVQANPHNHWTYGKADELLIRVPELHHALQQALPKTEGPGPRDQFRSEILGCIDNAESAAKLAGRIQHAVENKLLTNTEFNKLLRHAHEGQRARQREAQESARMLNMSNAPQTTNQIGLPQAATNGTVPPASAVMPLVLSQATPNVIAQLTNLAAPPQTTNIGAAVFLGPLTSRESARPELKSSKEILTQLLTDAQTRTRTKRDEVWYLFASMFDFSWQNSSDVDVMIEYVLKHPRFQGNDSNGRQKMNIDWTIKVIEELVKDKTPSSCEVLVWTCIEALNAQDVKPEGDILDAYITLDLRRKELKQLFRRISATNFQLMREVYPNGCLTWNEMKELAKTEELGYFDNSINEENLRYYPYMKDRKQYWADGVNMKKYIVDRITAQSMDTDQAAALSLLGSSKTKRNIADISFDHDKASKEKDVDATDDGQTDVQEAKEPALKRFRDAPTEKEERAALREKTARQADDSCRDDGMKRSRE